MKRAVAILAGGESQRMGQDKASLRREGVTLLERTATLALATAPQLLVIGRTQPEAWPLASTQFISDDTPSVGPLGGLATALRHLEDEALLLTLSCDLPLLTADALQWLWAQSEGKQDSHGVVTTTENGRQKQPLFAIYTPAVLPLIERQLSSGRRSLHALLEAGNFAYLAAPPEVEAALVNVNTPDEWTAALAATEIIN
jgi:molybdopterin-guanine dinucleotide biosynthesis protein A